MAPAGSHSWLPKTTKPQSKMRQNDFFRKIWKTPILHENDGFATKLRSPGGFFKSRNIFWAQSTLKKSSQIQFFRKKSSRVKKFFQKIEKSVRILTQKLVQKSSKNGFLHKILSRTDFFFWGVFERFGANKHHFGHFFQIPTWEMIFRGRISGKIWNVPHQHRFPAHIE